PGTRAPASHEIPPPVNEAAPERPSTGAKTSCSGVHCVGIGEFLWPEPSRCNTTTLTYPEPRCTSACEIYGLGAREHITDNPVIRLLNERVRHILADGVLDAEEAADLLVTLTAFAGGDFEKGEITKATSLPLCDPAPTMSFIDATICFTG